MSLETGWIVVIVLASVLLLLVIVFLILWSRKTKSTITRSPRSVKAYKDWMDDD